MSLKPADIHQVLQRGVVGQDPALRAISVAVFKHVAGEPMGNVLMIGNSGTGKTSIMRAIEQMYLSYKAFQKHRVVVRMNANSLANEEGDVITGRQLLRTLQDRALQILRGRATPDQVKLLIQHATVCIDEVDKVSATVARKPNPIGVNIQQSLLTLMEDEPVVFDTEFVIDGKLRPVQLEIDTGRMLFVCGGAFEELYDQVYARIVEDRGQDSLSQMVPDASGNVQFRQVFTLSEHLRQEDMFRFGMLPQFLSRFDSTLILRDLSTEDLEAIFSSGPGSLFETSRRFFQRFRIEFQLTDEARKLIAFRASLQPRVGARALKDVYGRVIQPFEFDPFQNDAVRPVGGEERFSLVLTEDLVRERLGL